MALFRFDNDEPISFCLFQCPRAIELKTTIEHHGGVVVGMLIDAKFILTHKEHAGKVATNHRHKLLDVSWIDKSIESNRMIPLYRFLLQPPAGGFERFDSSARDLIEIMEHLIAGDVNGLYTSLHKQYPHRSGAEWSHFHASYSPKIQFMIEEGQKRNTYRQHQAQVQITKIQAEVQVQITKIEAEAKQKFEADMRKIYSQNLLTDISVENAYDERPVSPPLVDEGSREVTIAPSDIPMSNTGSDDDSEYMQEETLVVSKYAVDSGAQRRGKARGVEFTSEDRRAIREFAHRFSPNNPQSRDWEEFARTASTV